VTDASRGAGEWLTVEAAAEALGVSTRTVWRRVKSGALRIDRGVYPRLVLVGADVVPETGASGAGAGVGVAQVSRLEAEVERLSREVERLEAVLAEVRSERDYLRRAHAASLSASQRLLEHVDAEEVQAEPVVESFRDWLARVFPFLGGGR